MAAPYDRSLSVTTAVGRPIGAEYFDISKKLQFMDTHNIGQSIISLANPWLDFLPSQEARDVAKRMNDESTKAFHFITFLYFNLFFVLLFYYFHSSLLHSSVWPLNSFLSIEVELASFFLFL